MLPIKILLTAVCLIVATSAFYIYINHPTYVGFILCALASSVLMARYVYASTSRYSVTVRTIVTALSSICITCVVVFVSFLIVINIKGV